MSAPPQTDTRREDMDVPTRFTWLVQSPLRSNLLRFLQSRSGESFGVEAFMQRFGRLQQDIENCLQELVAFGVASRTAGTPTRFTASRPADPNAARLLDGFLSGSASIRTLIDGDLTLGGNAKTCRLVSADTYGLVDINDTPFLGCEYTLEVYA